MAADVDVPLVPEGFAGVRVVAENGTRLADCYEERPGRYGWWVRNARMAKNNFKKIISET